MIINGAQNSAFLFGAGSLAGSVGEPFAQKGAPGFIFAVEGGFGGTDYIANGLDTHWGTTNFAIAQNEARIGVYVLDGSFFGDFNFANDYMRGCLGTATYGLACVWAGGSSPFIWDFQDVSMGAPIGAAMVRTLNDTNQAAILGNGGLREISIMGDPTLRLQVSAPPTSLNAWAVGVGEVFLAWAAAAETNAQYYIYRSASLHGPFTNRLAVTAATSYTDSSPPAGTNTYLVRAAALYTTGSGSFTNLSQGMIVSQSP